MSEYKISDPEVFEEYCKDYHKTEKEYTWDRYTSEETYTGWARVNSTRWGFFINGKLSCPFGAAVIDEGKYAERLFVLDNQFLKDHFELANKLLEKYKDIISTNLLDEEDGLRRTTVCSGYFIKKNKEYISVHGEPAFVCSERDFKELYWHNEKGQLHRTDGPALIKNGKESYYLEGKSLSKEDWEKKVKAVTNMPEEKKDNNKNISSINDPKVWEAYCKNPDESEVYFEDNYQSAVIVRGTNDKNYTGWAKGAVNSSLRAFFINGKISCPYGRALYWKDHKTSSQYYAYNGKTYSSILELWNANKENIPSFHSMVEVPENFNGVAFLSDWPGFSVSKDGKATSIHDEPNWHDSSGERKVWHQNGERHRETGPAVVYTNKSNPDEYYLDGKGFKKISWEEELKARKEKKQEKTEDKINPDKFNFKKVANAKDPHRDKTFTGSVIDDKGRIAHFKNGQYHREDGPAWENPNKVPGTIEEGWWLEGEQHNLNGPARIDSDFRMYYINGKFLKKEAWEKEVAEYRAQHPEFETFQERNKREMEKESHKQVEFYDDFEGMKSFTGSVIDVKGLVCYYKNGAKHREDGPAFINTRRNSNYVYQNYYCDGVSFHTNKTAWEKTVQKYQEEQEELNKNWSEFEKDMKETEEEETLVPSEKEEVAYRLAQKQLKALVRNVLADEMGNGNKAKRAVAFDFLGTELGSSLLIASMGVLLPKLENKIPTKYRKHLGRLNREFRVAGLAAVGTEALEVVTGALGTKTRNILEAIPNSVATSTTTINDKKEQVIEITTVSGQRTQG